MSYSHRNGETEPPTMAGMFGFRHSAGKRGWIVDVVERHGKFERVMDYMDDDDDSTLSIEDFDGQWWGPITGPWDETA